MTNHDGKHLLSSRRFLKLGGVSIIGISALGVSSLGRLILKPVIKDKGSFVAINPPYYGVSSSI